MNILNKKMILQGHHPSQMGMPGGMDHPRQSL